jgi:hypothetical protein
VRSISKAFPANGIYSLPPNKPVYGTFGPGPHGRQRPIIDFRTLADPPPMSGHRSKADLHPLIAETRSAMIDSAIEILSFKEVGVGAFHFVLYDEISNAF